MIGEIGGFELQLGKEVDGGTLFSLVVQLMLLCRVILAQLVDVEAQALLARINGGEQVDGWDVSPDKGLRFSNRLVIVRQVSYGRRFGGLCMSVVKGCMLQGWDVFECVGGGFLLQVWDVFGVL
ncbi:hypothetical protein Droror1_Dr00025668 [Drosera rotundifolia]